jgi:NAD(P)-dependent dehydrogenase (short-subunit alcohol dehydrogenase family)
MVNNDVGVAVVGGGYMGGGIAQTFAAHGIDTVLVDATAQRAQERVGQLHDEARRFATDGLLPDPAVERVVADLRAADLLESGLVDVTYVAEVVFERADVKKEVLGKISTIVGSESRHRDEHLGHPDRRARDDRQQAERFLGVHWMNPAPFIPCVEVIPSVQTPPPAAQRRQRCHEPRPATPTSGPAGPFHLGDDRLPRLSWGDGLVADHANARRRPGGRIMVAVLPCPLTVGRVDRSGTPLPAGRRDRTSRQPHHGSRRSAGDIPGSLLRPRPVINQDALGSPQRTRTRHPGDLPISQLVLPTRKPALDGVQGRLSGSRLASGVT